MLSPEKLDYASSFICSSLRILFLLLCKVFSNSFFQCTVLNSITSDPQGCAYGNGMCYHCEYIFFPSNIGQTCLRGRCVVLPEGEDVLWLGLRCQSCGPGACLAVSLPQLAWMRPGITRRSLCPQDLCQSLTTGTSEPFLFFHLRFYFSQLALETCADQL